MSVLNAESLMVKKISKRKVQFPWEGISGRIKKWTIVFLQYDSQYLITVGC